MATSQFDRLWTRFNFFLTIQLGLSGFLGLLLSDKGNPGAIWLPATLG